MKNIISKSEEALARQCIDAALKAGAQKVRVVLNKDCIDIISTLNGEIDKVSHCLDRALSIHLFVDGRFGSFSINRFEEKTILDFIDKSVETVRMLAPDECRDLPPIERVEKTAISGNELGICDPVYDSMDAESRISMALKASIFGRHEEENRRKGGMESDVASNKHIEGKGWKLISEEGEYSDSISDTLLMDSNGAYCRHTQTEFEYGVETTVEDDEGNKYSAYWWDSRPFYNQLNISEYSQVALNKAIANIGAQEHGGGRMKMVVDSDCAAKLVTPLLRAMNAFAIQQNNSFLCDCLGRKVFSEGLTIREICRTPGSDGSRLFDSEGVATTEYNIVENGILNRYFINTYMAAKMGCEPTVDDVIRPKLMPWPKPMGQKEILEYCGSGILVTGFNGGNSNSATGDYSFGIEGFTFENGKITGPVREMLITGNLVQLWNNLIATGNDARECMQKLIPTLAFDNVDFRG